MRSVADLGAGAGNVTKLIKERWPGAAVRSVLKAHPRWSQPGGGRRRRSNGCSRIWDRGRLRKNTTCIYSNASLHWLPNHAKLLPSILEKVEPGGVLAVQMPRNFGAPSHLLIAETALNGPWRSRVQRAWRRRHRFMRPLSIMPC